MERVNIIGAGLAGLSAAITLANHNIHCNLVSLQMSERAESVMAEGGINGVLDTMGENDSIENHYRDTIKSAAFISDEKAVRGLVSAAPRIIRFLSGLGVAFNQKDGVIQQRNFGGQKKKRTAYAKSSTGKQIMTALISECLKYEALGFVRRYPRHDFVELVIENGVCCGARIADIYTEEVTTLPGPVIMATGGMNGLFPGRTTGSSLNSADAVAKLFSQGVRLGNLEMIQFHPTTMKISGKRGLISEAARGEGGRLFVMRDGERWYFMEEKYPELGNLMSRDIVAREIYLVTHDPECGDQVYLDMTSISKEIWERNLPDLREEIIHYQGLDPARDYVPVEPGIHYFMGGIDVDISHRTNIRNLYAAGECCDQYHGANRLGANSMLGAIYGGFVAAGDIIKQPDLVVPEIKGTECSYDPKTDIELVKGSGEILFSSLGIIRDGRTLKEGLQELEKLLDSKKLSERDRNRIYLAIAMVQSAILRRESRGAHYRSDAKELDESMARLTKATFSGEVQVAFA